MAVTRADSDLLIEQLTRIGTTLTEIDTRLDGIDTKLLVTTTELLIMQARESNSHKNHDDILDAVPNKDGAFPIVPLRLETSL